MSVRDLFRRLEIEAEKPLIRSAAEGFLPRPENWKSLLLQEEEAVYKVTGEDLDGLELGGSVPLDEIMDGEGGRAAVARTRPETEETGGEEELDSLTDDDMEEFGGGSVSLDELLGDDAPRAASPKPASKKALDDTGGGMAEKIRGKTQSEGRELSLDELLEEFVPDKPKRKG